MFPKKKNYFVFRSQTRQSQIQPTLQDFLENLKNSPLSNRVIDDQSLKKISITI